jgi:hypothetical protein
VEKDLLTPPEIRSGRTSPETPGCGGRFLWQWCWRERAPELVSYGPAGGRDDLPLGDALREKRPRAGTFTLRVEVAGANPAATGMKYLCGLDCIVLEKP